MFPKLFLIQKEAGGRDLVLEKVFSCLRKAIAEVLVLVHIWAHLLCLHVCDMGWDCPGTEWCLPALSWPELSPLSRKFHCSCQKYSKGSWDNPFLSFSIAGPFCWLYWPLRWTCAAPQESVCLWNQGPLYIRDIHLSQQVLCCNWNLPSHFLHRDVWPPLGIVFSGIFSGMLTGVFAACCNQSVAPRTPLTSSSPHSGHAQFRDFILLDAVTHSCSLGAWFAISIHLLSPHILSRLPDVLI